MKRFYITPDVQVIPLVMDELMVLTASGNLPSGSQGHKMDDEEEDYS
ncbi:hypothetical protein [Alloprevotella tannerae]|jgi:hypothetical protein|nr:hypothetical protein [Alloprevotella tannerae]